MPPQNFREVKDKILEKASEKFLLLGVKSVTMDEIANDLGISKKTLYAHFSTKTKLVEGAALFVFDQISQGIEQIRRKEKDPVEEMFEIKNFAGRHLKNEKSSPQYQLQKYYPKIFLTIKKKQQNLLEDLIKSNLSKGIHLGIYRPDVPVNFTSRFYFVGMMGIKDPELFPESQYTASDLVDKHLEYHLRSIVTAQGLQTLVNLLNSNKRNENL